MISVIKAIEEFIESDKDYIDIKINKEHEDKVDNYIFTYTLNNLLGDSYDYKLIKGEHMDTLEIVKKDKLFFK